MIEYLPKPKNLARNYKLLLASAYGDAFGAPYETNNRDLSPLPIQHVLRENPRLGTPFGTWTDDTALNLAGAFGLIAHQGAHACDTMLQHYMAALTANVDPSTPLEDQRSFLRILRSLPELGWGNGCKRALSPGGSAVESDGSGALMRAPVLGYATNIRTYADLYSLADQNSRLTHIGGSQANCIYMYLAVLRGSMLIGEGPMSSRARTLKQAVSEYGPGLNGPYATLLELSSLPYADWVKECRASYAGSTVSEVMFSGVSLALRWVQMFCEGKRVNLTAIAMEGCEVGGDTDTRLAIALPLCANICEVPKAVEGWDFITAYDTVLTTYFTRFCASEQ